MTEADWSGEVLLVYLASAAPGSPPCVALSEVKFQQKGGRDFLAGCVPEHPQDWAAGLRAEVAWDQVAHILVFDSLAEYQERVAQAPAFWETAFGAPAEEPS